jgi:hypothetical protein
VPNYQGNLAGRRRIDPQAAYERASLAARVRNSPDGYIKSLERAELTAEQKLRLALLVLSFSVSGTGGEADRDGTLAGAR